MTVKKHGMYYQGSYILENRDKYRGKRDDIIYRSLWEMKVFRFLDRNPSVLWWASEEVAIPYISPVDGKRHRYFPDIIAAFKKRDGSTRIVMIEVKPLKQTQEPKPRRKSKKYLTEVATWGVNTAKWKAARIYCESRGWDFEFITETELGLIDK